MKKLAIYVEQHRRDEMMELTSNIASGEGYDD